MMALERVRRQLEEAERKVKEYEAAGDEKALAYWQGRVSVLEDWFDELRWKKL